VIADENDERALRPAHIGKRIGFSINALERKVRRFPGKVANALCQRHDESSATTQACTKQTRSGLEPTLNAGGRIGSPT
jgi:hypothetical protein